MAEASASPLTPPQQAAGAYGAIENSLIYSV